MEILALAYRLRPAPGLSRISLKASAQFLPFSMPSPPEPVSSRLEPDHSKVVFCFNLTMKTKDIRCRMMAFHLPVLRLCFVGLG
jgi:hypothetical protein